MHLKNAPAHVLYLGPRDFLRGSPLDRGLIGEHRGTGKSGNAGCSKQIAVESREGVSLSRSQQGTVRPSISTQPFTLYGGNNGGSLPLTVDVSLGSEGEGESWLWAVAGAWGWGCRQVRLSNSPTAPGKAAWYCPSSECHPAPRPHGQHTKSDFCINPRQAVSQSESSFMASGAVSSGDTGCEE